MSTTEDAKSERSRLEMENRDCRYCGGNGLLIVFHPRWSGGRIGRRKEYNGRGELADVPFPAEVSAHCSCPVGQWARDRTDPQLQRRIPWATDILAGRSRWLMSPPSAEGRDENGDVDAEPEAPTRAQIARLFKPAGGAA